jgi:hypothetical protein
MIEGIHGTIGSGKSVLLNYRMVQMAVDGRDLALNFEFNDQGLYLALRKRGMTHRAASDKIRNTIIIRTYEQMRGLKNRWLGFDEAHFWFFSRMYERVTLADVQFWSLSRKAGVDVTIVTQRWESIDTIVRQLASTIWAAKPLVSREVKQFPFSLALKLYNKTAVNKWLGLFMYTKVQDSMGNTNEARKSLMGATANKSIIPLDAWTARAYDTGKFFTSPLIEEDTRRARVTYLKAVFLGELVPLQTCPLCNGLGRSSFEFRLDDIQDGIWRPSADAHLHYGAIYSESGAPVLSSSECPVCSGSGYFSDPSAEDIGEARSAALAGTLGADLRAIAQGHELPRAAPGRGGWAGRGGRS